MEDWSFPPAYDEALPAAAGQPLLVPGARNNAPIRSREGDSDAIAGSLRLRLRQFAVLSQKMGRGRLSSLVAQVARGFRIARAGDHKGRIESRSGRRRALRRLSLRSGKRNLPRSRHQRHDRSTDCLRDRPRRLARHRQCACPHHVGHGRAPGRHGLRGGDLQPLCGQLGRASGRGAPGVQGLSVRRRTPRG